METKYEYLLESGYSQEEIERYTHAWAEGIISYLAENSPFVSENMRYLKDDFDPDLLLKLPVFYPDSFVLPPTIFKARFDILKEAFPDQHTDIVEKQFWGYEGWDLVYVTHDTIPSDVLYCPFLEIMSQGEESVHQAIASLKDPGSRIYKFILMLRKGIGMEVTAEDISEAHLLDLEASKWEVFYNAEFLLKQGLTKDIIADLLWYCPFLLTCSTGEMSAALTKSFGQNYAESMIEKAAAENWDYLLCDLY